MLSQNPSLFRLFLFQTMMEGVAEDEADEFLIRFNLNGVELNDEGFQKLQEEIALTSIEADCVMPWGKERVTFFIRRNAGRRGSRARPDPARFHPPVVARRKNRRGRHASVLRSLHQAPRCSNWSNTSPPPRCGHSACEMVG